MKSTNLQYIVHITPRPPLYHFIQVCPFVANSQQRFELHESPNNEVEDNITGTNIRTVTAKLILRNRKRSSAACLCVSSLNVIKLQPYWIAKQCHRVHKAWISPFT